jgi:2-hydroxy-3-keto-5-methylthiopentenyl-1-phosphate phosphatase
MYKATLICDADVGVLAVREDEHPANELALRAWQQWKEKGSCSAEFASIDMDLVDDYIRTQSVEPYFLDFFDFIYENHILFGVATQRMDRIVETILRRKGLDRIPVFANRIEVEPFTIRLRFPHYNKLDCDHCPSCNLYHLTNFRRPGVPLIFVGEKGYDVCSASAADLVFARGELRKGCERAGIACHPIANLRDVERILARMICKGELEALPRQENDEVRPLPPAANGDRGAPGPRS